MAFYVPPELDEWALTRLRNEKPQHIEPKALASLLGDALRATKEKGGLGEANVSKMVTYLANQLDGVDLSKLASDPRLADFHLLKHIGLLGKAVPRVEGGATQSRNFSVNRNTVREQLRLVLRALVVAGVVPEEVQPAFLSADWPSVPGIAFDPLPSLPRTKAAAGALVGDAVRIGGLDTAILHVFDASLLDIPDEAYLARLSPQFEALQGAVLLARHADRPREHRKALLTAIEGLVLAIGGRAELGALLTRGIETDLPRSGAPS